MHRPVIASLGCLLIGLIGAVIVKAENADIRIPETEIILAMQAALRADDKQWFAEHLHLPVRYYGTTFRMIRSKEWFLKHYQTIVGPELRAAILTQDPESYLKNYQGLMVGDGGRNIWLRDFGEGNTVKYEIITINNSE